MYKPIIFNTEMVRAIQAGRKTQTRRVMKPQPIMDEHGMWDWKDCQWMDDGLGFPQSGIEDHSPYQPGDILWGRETWGIMKCAICPADCASECIIERNGLTEGCDDGTYLYKATDNFDGPAESLKWRPSIHMPKAAARIFLRVKRAWPERLQDGFSEPISPILDLQAEGIDIGDTCRQCIDDYGSPCCVDSVDDDGLSRYGDECGMLDEARAEFAALWDSLSAKRGHGWDTNPWVWAIDFERIEKPEKWVDEAVGGN